jgi:hypothetical protein
MPRPLCAAPPAVLACAALALLAGAPGHAGAASTAPAVAARPAAVATPAAGETFEAWCARLQRAEPFVPFRCSVETDWLDPSHPSRTRRVQLRIADFGAAFELARRLFQVPASVTLPRSGPREQAVEDPGKPAEVWESTLTVARDAAGAPRRASWFERREGSGRTVTVRRIDARTIELGEAAFAD